MFRRRNKPTLPQLIWSWIWPRGGWRRFWRYLMIRLARMPGSSYSIAAGFAVGAAVSFTPFVGFHIAISAAIAWMTRANILSSAIGTAVGNPWTFPFIWVWLYQSGNWMLLNAPGSETEIPNFDATFDAIMYAMVRIDIPGLFDAAIPVFWPMFLSGIPTGFAVWVVFYFPLRRLIRSYQVRRLNKSRASIAHITKRTQIP
jgi:uncharacterized protein